jgi:hypothetical protein
MGPFFDLSVEIDGQRFPGTWSLRQGGVVHVACVPRADHADVGADKPETVAARLLEAIVITERQRRADEQAFQTHEMAKQRRRRNAAEKRFVAQLVGAPDPLHEVLRRLVEHVEGSGYKDPNGNALMMSPAFLEAMALLRDYSGQP